MKRELARVTQERDLYAMVLDLYSRAVIGWTIGVPLTGDLALKALTMAIYHRTPKAGLLHHSDRGCQYAATACQLMLTTCIESFFGTVCRETMISVVLSGLTVSWSQ